MTDKERILCALRGGYILSSSSTIHPGCKAENYLAMVAAAEQHGIYPIG
jgi:type II secretory pathway component PulF